MTSAYDMLYALINVYEDNNQVETEVRDSCSQFRDEEEQKSTSRSECLGGFLSNRD
jgi:hypothetical protein